MGAGAAKKAVFPLTTSAIPTNKSGGFVGYLKKMDILPRGRTLNSAAAAFETVTPPTSQTASHIAKGDAAECFLV